VNVIRLDDPDAFLERAGAFLFANEPRNNLILGIASTIVDNPGYYPEHAFWLVEEEGVVGAALRTPPYNLVLADMSVDAAKALSAAVNDEDLPGVVGLVPAIDVFDGETVVGQGVFALEQVDDVPRPAGAARVATAADRELLLRWYEGFVDEALPPGSHPAADTERAIDYRLGGAGRGMWLWDVDGAAVSMSGWGGRTPNGIRVGPVYTPPSLRGRGYASALVADLSRHLLAEGRRFCFLYTDLANPTSNAIYERVGYRRVGESRELAFARS
jgi:uncharacterized protein